jgi:hypothetical protein
MTHDGNGVCIAAVETMLIFAARARSNLGASRRDADARLHECRRTGVRSSTPGEQSSTRSVTGRAAQGSELSSIFARRAGRLAADALI